MPVLVTDKQADLSRSQHGLRGLSLSRLHLSSQGYAQAKFLGLMFGDIDYTVTNWGFALIAFES